MMTQYVVIGTHPEIATTVAVGPFRSPETASKAWDRLTALGYVAETLPLGSLLELESITAEEN